MLNTRAVLRRVADAWSRQGWVDRDGAMLVAADRLARGITPQALVKQLPSNFYSANRITRKQVADALVDILINTEANMDATTLNLLFVSSGPQDQDRLRLDAEQRDIMAKIKAATHRDKIVMSNVPAARPGDLIDAFNEFHPTVIHISGHGDANSIVLEDTTGTTAEVDASLLVDLVAVAGSQLKVVVLNACKSATLAQELTKVVDIAIGMNASVGDDAALAFAVQFYSSIGAGVPIKQAFEQAKVGIKASGNPGSDIPELYTRKGLKLENYTVLPGSL